MSYASISVETKIAYCTVSGTGDQPVGKHRDLSRPSSGRPACARFAPSRPAGTPRRPRRKRLDCCDGGEEAAPEARKEQRAVQPDNLTAARGSAG